MEADDSKQSPKYCPMCGATLQGQPNFCSTCGADLDEIFNPYEDCCSHNVKASKNSCSCGCDDDFSCGDSGCDCSCDCGDDCSCGGNGAMAKKINKRNIPLAIISFLCPIVGLLFYGLWKDTAPKRAKSCLIGMIIGLCLWVLFIVIVTCSAAVIGSSIVY